MYTNIGSKIQKVAKIIAWIGIVLTVLIAAFMIYGGVNSYNMDMLVQGVVTLIIGPLACWISSLTLVGFGKLIQTNDEMKAQIEQLNNQVSEIKNR